MVYETTTLIILGLMVTLFNFSILHKVSKSTCVNCSKINRHLASFGAGFVILFLFLKMLPDAYSYSVEQFGNISILAYAVVAGFVIFLLLEHFVYKHVPKEKMKEEENILHSFFLFAFHFIEGAVLVGIIATGLVNALLFFVVLLAINMAEDFSLHFLRGKEAMSSMLVLSSATLIGILFAIFVPLGAVISTILLAFVAGVLVYMVSAELIPKEKTKHVAYLISGMVFFIVLEIVLNIILR